VHLTPVYKDFAEVDKTDFKEVCSRYRNAKKRVKEKNLEVLEKKYFSIKAPPVKANIAKVFISD